MSVFYFSATAKKAKKVKEPEAPILYDDPPDKMTSKDGRDANMKIILECRWAEGLGEKEGSGCEFAVTLRNIS